MGMGTVSLRLALAATAAIPWQGNLLYAQGLPLTLEAAVQRARDNNRVVQAGRVRIAEARGDLTGASLRLEDNPEVAGVAGPRLLGDTAGGTTPDWEIGVEQRFETGGQRGYRIERALADVDASAANASDVERVITLAVVTTFYETLAAGRRLTLLEENQRLARELHSVAERRLEAGEGIPLEVNTARIRRAEVERRSLAARVTYELSTVRLAELLGLPPDTRLELQGDLPGDEVAPPIDELVAHALASRPDLAAVEHELEAAKASIGLADAGARPDLAVGVFYGREGRDDIVIGGLRLPIPIFNRNQGERERTRAVRDRLVAEQAGIRLRIASEVQQELLAYEQFRRAFQLYSDDVLRAHEESAGLLQRAFEVGEVGVQDLIVVQRELLEGREGYLDAGLDVARARARVLAAAARSQTGSLAGVTP